MNFRIGQKVVCVDDSPTKNGSPLPVKKGRTYTVTDMYACNCGCGQTGIRVKEVYYNRWMAIKRFRPVEYYGNAIQEVLKKFAPVPEVPATEEELIESTNTNRYEYTN